MGIDQIHHTQHVFRKILDSMAKPGTISTITVNEESKKRQLSCYDTTLLAALTLLDAEVTFHILPADQIELKEKISQYTLAQHAPIEEADFIIAVKGCAERELVDAMLVCKNGSLIDPNGSATWIIEEEHLSNQGGLTLSGPGIRSEAELHISFTLAMTAARQEKIKEYPTGIDLLFTDEVGQLACLPRTTTVIHAEEVK
ncbi:phosphonate C-P lyase system protein PhnH [Cytobacillus purgationiresistens]|uniref:Alpha-D-ribose 1-methylphosphonate 5-triphosphate synthase subunit PhnH n=1 Tax=Cytobacillus purgationiresistens TaxID=863449 RepID=A0ABU0AKR0_9BACI|nr:phosphonate C-P lyase system protein PhnH [Cytobacillus purgationiresistens]MDQ0271844.1 alpha-D-ribose 1-methylphosphonate 5-triphosphate synthase subunit PhnH [Cytobacillus purgationiresistens]